MGRINRCELIDETDVGVYHCISRCVRRAWLCGRDPVTHRSFEHRKEWLQERLVFLARCFALDVLAFSIMSNHLHVILRNRPDLVAGWSDEEVVRRWWQLFPRRRDDDGSPAEPTQAELDAMCLDESYVAERRRRLSSISSFMRCLREPLARQANREDNVTGHFWEARFRCQPLLDEAAVLACAVYVDLNPVKARLAEMPETARFTSIYERILSQNDQGEDATSPGESSDRLESRATSATPPASWLSPVQLLKEEHQFPRSSAFRASDRGFLPMTQNRYIELVTWTALQLQARSCEPTMHESVGELLAGMHVDAGTFVRWVERFGRLTRRAAGRDPSFTREAARCGRNWLQRSRESRRLLG